MKQSSLNSLKLKLESTESFISRGGVIKVLKSRKAKDSNFIKKAKSKRRR